MNMKVLNFGSLNIDYVYEVDNFVKKGETIASKSMQQFVGGKGLNQTVALKRAGVNVAHAGSVGKDGSFLLDYLSNEGIDTSLIYINPDVKTGHAIIQIDHSHDNCILLYGGANRAIPAFYFDKILHTYQAGDFIVLQNEINDVSKIIEQAHEKGMIVIYNPAPMNEDAKQVNFDFVDYLILNEHEASALLNIDPENISQLIEGLARRFSNKHIILTLGETGSVYIHGERIYRQKAYRAPVVDTTGAGDTFIGFFVASIVKGKTIKISMDIASRASSMAISKKGAAPSIPYIADIDE